MLLFLQRSGPNPAMPVGQECSAMVASTTPLSGGGCHLHLSGSRTEGVVGGMTCPCPWNGEWRTSGEAGVDNQVVTIPLLPVALGGGSTGGWLRLPRCGVLVDVTCISEAAGRKGLWWDDVSVSLEWGVEMPLEEEEATDVDEEA
ncbi:hypothetical protein AV530_014205 [Patagioenas fasciata monilis]|uniref:Uncharacterized protein n=1 Tax=Patagioenas fasciata monilis TaxID=372326 RepID=A0A1V4KBH4_PATFA|nr:hypothetical protein AV530_014205 [Patagioenas fasciata monilis]